MPAHEPGTFAQEEVLKRPKLLGTALLAALAAAAGFLLGFLRIAHEMLEGETLNFDMQVRTWVHQFASPHLTFVMEAISLMGSDVLVVLLLISLVVFLLKGWRRAFLWMVITIAGALVLDLALKYGYHRPRPVPFFGSVPHSWSFPSGHALFSFCFYGVLAGLIMGRVRSRWLRVLIWVSAAVLIVLIGVSRIYLGVHYPSDVVAGYLAAALWVSSVIALDRLGSSLKSRRNTPEATGGNADQV